MERITPASLDFHIVSSIPDKVYDGLIIEYRVRPLMGIAVKWVSRIGQLKPPHQFMDEQLQGPYTFWQHTHRFVAVEGGVMMGDDIEYDFPLSHIFPFLDALIVRKELNRIFDFRSKELQKIF